MNWQVGDIVEGVIVKVADYGAFVNIDGGGRGMIHISEIANRYVKSVSDYLRVGDRIRAKVIKIDDRGRIDLSLKAIEDEKSFEDKLARYMKESEERINVMSKKRDASRKRRDRRG